MSVLHKNSVCICVLKNFPLLIPQDSCFTNTPLGAHTVSVLCVSIAITAPT